MIIHTDMLNRGYFYLAASKAGVEIVDVIEKGSRSRKRAFNFAISGSGRHGGQWGVQNYKSATWDEWGIFLAFLFEVDPHAHTGKNGYESEIHFHWATGGRFRSLTNAEQHRRHRWRASGRVVTRSHYVQECDCGASFRRMASGYEFAAIA